MSGLFIMGEAPGPEEGERGDPMVGATGRWIDAGLAQERRIGPDALRLWAPFVKPPTCLGCPLYEDGGPFVPGSGSERVFVSNVRRCMPPENETPEDKAASIAHCARVYLTPELERINPRAILLVGGDALKLMTGLTQAQKYHGSIWHRAAVDEIRRALGVSNTAPSATNLTHTIAFTLHPAHAMRRGIPQLKPTIVATVMRAKRWSERPAGLVLMWGFRLEPTPDELAETLLGPLSGPVAVDVETEHENHSRITICGASVKNGEAIVTPWTDEFRGVWAEFLARRDVIKIGHNFAFDRNAFAAYGIEVAPPVRDTIQMGSLLHPPFKGAEKIRWLNLPSCAIRVMDALANWKEPEKPETRAYFRAMFPQVPEWLHSRLYNGVDVIVTRLLSGAQEEALRLEGMW